MQLANFGRASTALIPIRDAAVVATSGKVHHKSAVGSNDLGDEVAGIVFEITPRELEAADRYEVSDYPRVLVMLKSGAQAWAYVQA